MSKELIEQLRELSAKRKPYATGAHGQMIGMESYRIVANGFALECIEEAADRIEELERENNELLADAMRYRWIKEQSDGRPFYFHAIRHKHAENLDAAIDAALAKVRKP